MVIDYVNGVLFRPIWGAERGCAVGWDGPQTFFLLHGFHEQYFFFYFWVSRFFAAFEFPLKQFGEAWRGCFENSV